MMNNELYRQWIEALEQIDAKPLSDDTVARLLAIVYHYGGSMEAFVYNQKLIADIEYCQRRCHLRGGEVPDAKMALRVQQYIISLGKELENAPKDKNSKSSLAIVHPEWVCKLMRERYGIEEMNL